MPCQASRHLIGEALRALMLAVFRAGTTARAVVDAVCLEPQTARNQGLPVVNVKSGALPYAVLAGLVPAPISRPPLSALIPGDAVRFQIQYSCPALSTAFN